MTRKPRILVVGSINMDLVLSVDKAPEGGETVLGNGYFYVPGGKGANQAVAAARLGCEVSFAGRVGKDVNGEVMLKNLQREGIDTSNITEDASSQSGLAVIPVEASGQNRIIVIPGANSKVGITDVQNALKRDYDAIMVQLEIPLETAYAAASMGRAKGIPVILDAGPATKLALDRLKDFDIISPNEPEAHALTGITIKDDADAVKAATRLAETSGVKRVVLKLGKRGALLYEGGNCEFFDAFQDIRAIDTTAAGDCFTAALTAQLCIHGDIRRAIRYSNAAGGICVSRKGAQPSLPTAEEVSDFLISRGISV